MILIVDVAYADSAAWVAGVLADCWHAAVPVRELLLEAGDVAPYVPGDFYRRELPCILALLEQVPEPLDCIVIDGYVTLGSEHRPGLGMHLWNRLEGRTPVIGVAKTAFHDTPAESRVQRAGSSRMLFVTAAGMPLSAAKAAVEGMHGPFRLPTLLKLVDSLCRTQGRQQRS